MIRVVLEVRFVGLVGVKIDLGVLKHFQRVFEASWDLLANEIQRISGYFELL